MTQRVEHYWSVPAERLDFTYEWAADFDEAVANAKYRLDREVGNLPNEVSPVYFVVSGATQQEAVVVAKITYKKTIEFFVDKVGATDAVE